MTEGRPEIVRLDEAIDRAVRDLTAHEAPADLRARVLARLEEPASAGVWWSPGRVAAAAGAVAVVAIATYLGWSSRTAPVAEPSAVVAEARRPAESPVAPPAAAAPGPGVAAEMPAPSRLAERTAAAALVEPEPYVFRSPREVAGLPVPEPIAIDPMPPDAIDVAPVTVEPLAFERLTFEPIGGSR